MADWYGSARSNYFKVKDIESFKDFIFKWGGEFIDKQHAILTDNCRQCQTGKVDMKCKDYLKAIAGECEGIKEDLKLVGFLGESDKGGIPSYYCDEDTGIEYDFDDFVKELSTHLVDGWVAEMMECGAEKMRYITGFALAVNSKGETKSINLASIHEEAKALGSEITNCEY